MSFKNFLVINNRLDDRCDQNADVCGADAHSEVITLFLFNVLVLFIFLFIAIV